ncbi:HNH endonuclease [Comamonas sp. CMM02]|nr:HNH endonuclease [Comamonas sp. CMM02]
MANYKTDRTYTRGDIMSALGVTDTGGAWFTGHVTHSGEHYIFCNIQVAGRTGPNYDNHFEGDELVWHTRKGAKFTHKVPAALISNTSPVHIFFREKNRDAFSYRGPAHALDWREGASAMIRWGFATDESIPEEIAPGATVSEGAKRQITINAYERDPSARARCLKRWGVCCAVCGFDFERRYGELGRGYIHVHHLLPLASIGQEYQLNPEEDLRPVCPNCHAMLHRSAAQPMTIDALKKVLRSET